MILATDVYYPDDGSACSAGVLFSDWTSSDVQQQIVVRLDHVASYKPGQFYERELPCLMALMEKLPELPDLILVDGYVTLGMEHSAGLGMYLYQALNGEIPVIGIAKNRFRDTPAEFEIYRGKSHQPLFVTAVGIDPKDARDGVNAMYGPHRIPYMLKRVDLLCRGHKEDV